jgi:hypothetical protein
VSFRLLEEARIFHEWDRIPLYYCWRCADDISYRFTKRGKIKVFDREGCPQGDDFPYRGFPHQFSRKPVSLVPIPYEVAKLLAISQEIDEDEDWLSDDDRNLIAKELSPLRHDGFGEEMRHQIGGLVKCVQGHEHVRCPNKKCERHKLFKDSKTFHMKELAVIHNDPRSGLPMVESLEEFERTSRFNDWVQLVYWICDECLAITATNRCD